MTLPLPFYRTVRKMKGSRPSTYGPTPYILDPRYAANARHYVRAYLLIQKDLETLFEYVEPSDIASNTYSYRVHELLMRTCIEVEANLRAILSENGYVAKKTPDGKKFILNMSVYRKVDKSHRLSDYEVLLPIWKGQKGNSNHSLSGT